VSGVAPLRRGVDRAGRDGYNAPGRVTPARRGVEREEVAVDFETARMNMVESQLRTNKVTDQRVLEAFETVPRERFVPKHLKSLAYIDEDLRIAGSRYMVEPMVLARLLDHADLQPADVVLVVGSGTGYPLAVLSRLVATVIGLESDPALAEQGEAALREQSVDNVVVIQGDMAQGYKKQGPYDVILTNGAVGELPTALTDQLSPEGGRLLTVIRGDAGPGKATAMERWGEAVGRRTLFDANTPVLPGFERRRGFVF
jgi:protein-L-isoaspartate(D-aspartate) O-methyltransferase